MSKRFEGTADYVATDDLKIAVNAAIVLERPLLIKGEPGTGKTVLAEEIERALVLMGCPGAGQLDRSWLVAAEPQSDGLPRQGPP